jgi:hypothetical protein
MAHIGFLIIGAQKAGTSSLFEYLRRHPQVHIPPEKETFFFSEDRKFRRGWDWYSETMLRNSPAEAVCGEASTAYMSGTPVSGAFDRAQDSLPAHSEPSETHTARADVVPRRIKHFLPDVKLICVLRDPVARAFSHYQMTVMERAESRSFDEAIRDLLAPGALDEARVAPTRTNAYVVNGEYGRVLAGYLRTFPRTQLLVIFSDELAAEPAATLARAFEFIGVAPDFVPDNLHTRYRAAATKQRIPGLDLHTWRLAAARVRPARALWRALPYRIRDVLDRAFYVIGYRVGLWNARRGTGAVGKEMSPDARRALIAHYRPDSEALSQLIGSEAPWGWT